jgi:putative ABC transport system permease protein
MRIDSFRQDARSASRCLLYRPMATAASIGMLALAIGITAAMFTLVDALQLRPIPFPDADQLAVVRLTGKNGGPATIQPTVLAAWRETHAFASVEGVRSAEAVVSTDTGDVSANVARVTPGIFNLLGGVRPVRGRMFDANDGRPGAGNRVLISDDLWRARYDADPSLVGRTITIDSKPVDVVGILPAEFRFPNFDTQIWRADSFDDPRIGPAEWPLVYVRFAANVPRADALRLATAAAIQAGTAPDKWVTSDPLGATGPDDYYAHAIPLLSGGAALLFLVLCANVSSLLLAGLTARRRDFATRVALGAPRWRLIRQAIIESGLTGAGGLVAGVGLAWALVSIARAVLPHAALVHSLNPLNLDVRALVVASASGLLATLCAGVVPAIISTRVDAGRALQMAGRSGTETRQARMATRILLTGQIALSCMLLIGATVLVRSFVNLMTADRGIDTSNILVAWVAMVDPSLRTPEAREAAARAIEEQMRTLPGVTHAAWSYGTPPRGAIGLAGDWTPSGRPPINLSASQSIVSREFFALYGIPILRGRAFEPSDSKDAIVISERLAKSLWPDSDPLGQTVGLDNQEESPRRHRELTIIGVAKDTRFPSLRRNQDVPQVYAQYRATIYTPMLSLRCAGPCPDVSVARRRLAEVAPGVRVQDLDLLDDVYATQFARPRATAFLAFTFAVTALIAAAAGLFSLLSYSAARRRREFGIRSALGASPSNVRNLVWRDGFMVTLTGIGLGTIAGVSIARLLTSMLYDVTMTDPLSWVIVAGVLTLTIAAASWPPARTATRTSPVTLLREE